MKAGIAYAGALLATLAFQSVAQAGATQTLELNGKTATVTSDIPAEVFGRYLYEKKGEPIVELRPDGTGIFQPHGVPGIPVKYWLLTDENGTPVKQTGEGTLNYQYTVIVEYGPGGGGNYPEGKYGSFYWTMRVDKGCSIVLGERWKCG